MAIRVKRISAVLAAALLIAASVTATAQETGKFVMPHYEKYVLDNGLTVYLLEQHEVPLVYLTTVFPAGAVCDGDMSGLAELTAEGLMFGTEKYSKEDIEGTFDFLGAGISSSASLESASLGISCAAKDVDKLFAIAAEVITKPTFVEEEFTKLKQRRLAELLQAREQPRGVIGEFFNSFVYGDYPYGNPVAGTRAAVEALTIDDLKNFYASHYLPSKSAIAVAGDFNTTEMKARIESLFGGWQTEAGVLPNPLEGASIPEPGKARMLLVNKDDATETAFMIGGPGIKRDNPDYIQVMVINTLFGGRFTSWLNDELRVNAGLTYGVRSRFDALGKGGTFYISSYTRNESIGQALDICLGLLEKLHAEGIDQKTLDSAKAYVKGQFPPGYETAGQLAGLLTTMFVYGLDDSMINDFNVTVDSMTLERAKEIIAKYFPRENLQFVLIGKADAVRDIVSKYGELSEKEIKAEGF